MANYYNNNDVFLKDNTFLRLGFRDYDGDVSVADRMRYDVGAAVKQLRDDPDFGARFLGSVGGADGDGTIYWDGDLSSVRVDGESVGVRVVHRREGGEIVGENSFGRFLTDVRRRYREYLSSHVVPERAREEDRVVCDFTRKGSLESDIELRERAGERFIHTDVYRPARWRRDASLNGTTGHARRESDPEVSFQTFVCPFGTGYPSPLVVGSAAEASMLYERALRGELDWNALMRSLSERGLMARNVSERQKRDMAQGYRAQFDWMREQIATNPDLRGMRIVSSSLLVPDDSMGRSVYDYDHAPSPAHVLQRYIDNPILLYSPSENGVARAIAGPDREEPLRFNLEGGDAGTVRILVVGSDTVGGREPGAKASSRMVREFTKDEAGNRVIRSVKQYDMPFKTQDRIEADYASFRRRMDEVLSSLPEGVRVELVSGNSSSFGDSVGVGTPRMVERYVSEKGGRVYSWNFTRRAPVPVPARGGKEAEPDGRLSAVVMDHFADCVPVMAGRTQKVTFLLDSKDSDSDVTFAASDGLVSQAAVCFSVADDSNNRNVLSLGSFVADSGLPVVHVQEVRSEDEQKGMLSSGAALSLEALTGGGAPDRSLFADGDRLVWDLDNSNIVSYMDSRDNRAVPLVALRQAAGVTVGGYTFNSAYGAYAALLARETGHGGAEAMVSIRSAEGSVSGVSGVLTGLVGDDIPDLEVQERCLRRAVRLMCEADSSFADRLTDLDGRDVVMPVRDGDTTLFTSLDGHGANRFGVVLAAERDRMKELREARRAREEEERVKVLEEASRKQKVLDDRRAEGQKVEGGLPRNIEQAEGAVWFAGTHPLDALELPDGRRSFVMWDDMGGDDRLTRAKAVARTVDDGEGGRFENNLVFLFPSDLVSVMGRSKGSPGHDSVNLTDCMREDPRTGEKFLCAFGVPVRYNNKGIEPRNKELLPSSYRLDNDAANYSRSVVLADSLARVQAIRHGMSLCLPGRQRANGEDYYTLGQVFMDKVYTRRDGWTDNQHRSPLNLDLTNRYISVLERGRSVPLNVIPMPRAEYSADDYGQEEGSESKARVTAEGRFVSDLNFSLRMANAAALALGVPLRFPLDGEGRIDLGPGVPEEFRNLAERKIDSFIGVVGENQVLDGTLPVLEKVSRMQSIRVRSDGQLRKAGDLFIRPNDLVAAFGGYDFEELFNGGTAPLHEMMFRMDDDYFFVVDAKLNKGMRAADVQKYILYEKNDLRRFTVRSNNPDRVPEFQAVLSEYVARAKAVTVEMRLVQESQIRAVDPSLAGTDMRGFVNLLDSGSDGFASGEHDIGRQASVYNAAGRTGTDGRMEERNVNGEKVEGVYDGRELSKDGFSGYAQIRYSYDGAAFSPWVKVDDLDLAKDIVMTLVDRKYSPSDDRVVPSAKTMDLFLKAEAMRHLIADGTVLEKAPGGRAKAEADSKVVTIDRTVGVDRAEPARINVYFGSGENAVLSNFAERPLDYTLPDGETVTFASVEQGFQYMKSYYAPHEGRERLDAYRRAVMSTTKGMELRAVGKGGISIDSFAWDAVSEGIMRTMVLASFDPARNPDAARALVATGDAVLTHEQDSSKWGTLFPEILMDVRGKIRDKVPEKRAGRVFVTYYSSRNVPEDAYRVSISASVPKGMSMDADLETLHPVYRTMVGPHKEGKISDGEYCDRYRSKVLEPNRDKIIGQVGSLRERAAAQGKDVYLFCYERPGDFCHRYLVSNFLNENGVECRENPGDRKMYVTGRVPLVNDGNGAGPEAAAEPELSFDPGDTLPVFTTSKGGYRQRTEENANAEDVDFTFAFAVDFDTYGERATARAAGDSLVKVELDTVPGKGLDISGKAVQRAVSAIGNALPEEYLNGEACGLNIAGNGIYTLASRGVTQDQMDEFVLRVLDGLCKRGLTVSSLRSGGQTGVDEAGIAAAMALGIPSTVHTTADWAFRGRDNVDVKDMDGFKSRFTAKDIDKLKERAGLAARRQSPKESAGIRPPKI